jgi:hypothetical protein
MRMYRQEGADVGFISKMVKKRFNLGNADQASQCACEMLEDFCPGFVAMVLNEIGESASALLNALVVIAQDGRFGVMAKDACEALAIRVLLEGNDVTACANSVRRISEVSGISLLRIETWIETYIEKGFGQSVYLMANHLASGERGKPPENGMSQEMTSSHKWGNTNRSGYISNLFANLIKRLRHLFAPKVSQNPVLQFSRTFMTCLERMPDGQTRNDADKLYAAVCANREGAVGFAKGLCDRAKDSPDLYQPAWLIGLAVHKAFRDDSLAKFIADHADSLGVDLQQVMERMETIRKD